MKEMEVGLPHFLQSFCSYPLVAVFGDELVSWTNLWSHLVQLLFSLWKRSTVKPVMQTVLRWGATLKAFWQTETAARESWKTFSVSVFSISEAIEKLGKIPEELVGPLPLEVLWKSNYLPRLALCQRSYKPFSLQRERETSRYIQRDISRYMCMYLLVYTFTDNTKCKYKPCQ